MTPTLGAVALGIPEAGLTPTPDPGITTAASCFKARRWLLNLFFADDLSAEEGEPIATGAVEAGATDEE